MNAARPLPSLLAPPHLSASRIEKYLRCPEQYRLYYVENLRTRLPSGALVFGSALHASLAHLFQVGEDPVSFFESEWAEQKNRELSFSARESWSKLDQIGRRLLDQFVSEALPKITEAESSEESFSLDITSLGVPLVGVIDLVAQLDGVPTVIDFKTSGSRYGGHEAALSDQLTCYHLAKPQIRQSALLVFMKTQTPRIEWHLTRRQGSDFSAFLEKTGIVLRAIEAGEFYRRPGSWCSYCDYLPVCLGDERHARATLVQLES